MSISNLFIPNNYNLFCNTITPNSITIDSIDVDQLQINNPNASISTDLILSINSNGNVNKSNITLSSIVNSTANQTLTGKTIDSANNTLLVNGTNINSIINQDVRTSANASFNSVTLGTLNTDFINIYSMPTVNDTSNVLALAGTSLVTRDDIVNTTSIQTITGKTIDSASNALLVNSININSLINQDVRTTSSPQFVAVQFQTKPLNYYDNGSFSVNWTGAGTVTTSVHYVRIGTFINFIFYPANTTFNGVGNVLTGAGSVPTALRPVGTVVSSMVPIIDNGTNTTLPGIVTINASGNINLLPTLNFSSTFLGPGNVGFTGFSMSYNIS
jgi:hypothetical protein